MNPYLKSNNAYKKAAVTTQDQGSLILMLFDGGIRFLKAAIKKIEEKDLEQAHHNIIKGKDIVSELIASLNVDDTGDVGNNLKTIYVFIYNKLIDANIQKDANLIKEIIVLLDELRGGWRHVVNHKKEAAKSQNFNSRGAVKPIEIKG
ncbi:MAG: flagellar export chaperone FliS [Deltaproteobacteria bacterium]|nr:flagellar export chaperone FliS [Deltaproteobacteria bacterium]